MANQRSGAGGINFDGLLITATVITAKETLNLDVLCKRLLEAEEGANEATISEADCERFPKAEAG